MQTGGFFFIPFFGGVALAKGEVPSRAADIRISLAGPLFGLLMCFVAMGLYAATQKPIFAIAVLVNGVINLFNLVPVYPLDGGRVLRAMAVGNSSFRARMFFIATMTLLALLSFIVRFPITVVIGAMAYFSLVADIKRLLDQERRNESLSNLVDRLYALEMEDCSERKELIQGMKEAMKQNGVLVEPCADLRFSEGFYGAIVYSVLVAAFLAVTLISISVPGVDVFKPG
jgi:membrane-associated protease RseP (regulator of RpoE activity)